MTMSMVLALTVLAVVTWPSSTVRRAALLSVVRGRCRRGPDVDDESAQEACPTRARRLRRRLRAHEILDRRAQIAEVVSVGLEAGLTLPDAWALALEAEFSPARDPEGDRRGPPVPDLLDLALALTETSGAPAATAARAAAHQLRAQAAAARKKESLLAGSHASMAVLTLLPIVGPLITWVVGASFVEVYAGAWASVSVAFGLMLTTAGVLVARAMLARAARPAALRRPAGVRSKPRKRSAREVRV